MKKSIPSLALVCVVAITQSCTEEIAPAPQKVEIAFSLLSEEDTPTDPASSRLVVRIESQSGQPVIEYEQIKFTMQKNRFVTEALDLPFGTYTITDFMLVNDHDDMLYAVPRASATLGRSVTQPLDLRFTFSHSGPESAVNLTLLDVRNKNASDFGYGSLKRPGRRLSVMVLAGKNPKPVASSAFILNGKDTLNRYELKPGANHVAIPREIAADQIFVISKAGYAPAQYILAELVQDAEKKPLTVSLAPAFTMLASIDLSVSPVFDFYLGGPEGTSITIDWGEGATENFDLNGEVNLTHFYGKTGTYPITISGDIEKINYFYSFYGQAMVDAIDFQHLTDLREIRFGLTGSPATIDLTQNARLEYVMLSGLQGMKALLMPTEHRINQLLIEGPNQMNTAAVDGVIDNLYRNAKKQNILNGTLSMPADWASEDKSLLGPPSAAAMMQLRSLNENYGWTIFPDPFDAGI